MFENFSMNSFRLDGNVAIVTGANQGIGMAFAVALAKAGADLFIPHLTDNITEIQELIEKEGRRAAFFQGDLTDPAYMDAIVRNACAYMAKSTFSSITRALTLLLNLRISRMKFGKRSRMSASAPVITWGAAWRFR